MDETEEYVEVSTEYEEDFTVSDYVFIGFLTLIGLLIITIVLKQVRKTFKNIHLKVGDKIEVGVDTKE